MDKPRIYRPKWPLKVLGVLMMVAGVVVLAFVTYARTRGQESTYAPHVGMSLFVLGATFLSDAFR